MLDPTPHDSISEATSMLGKNQRSSRPQMGHVQLGTIVQYSGKKENKRSFQASSTW